MRKYEAIRTEIKKLSAEQVEMKPLRKTSINTNPESEFNPFRAQLRCLTNKNTLRHLFQAYAILKGIKIPKPNYHENDLYNYSEAKVLKMVEKYRPVEVLEEI